jgi:histidine ammonia-lyase
MIDNVAHILAIEWLAAAQGIEFLRPLASSAPLERAHALLRVLAPAMPRDRVPAPDIEAAAARVRSGALSEVFRSLPGLPALWVPA